MSEPTATGRRKRDPILGQFWDLVGDVREMERDRLDAALEIRDALDELTHLREIVGRVVDHHEAPYYQGRAQWLWCSVRLAEHTECFLSEDEAWAVERARARTTESGRPRNGSTPQEPVR